MPEPKRLMDLVASLAGLAALSPLLLAIAIAVKLDSKGPAFFGHERVGRDFMPFKVWKFRTMAVGNAGPEITTADDQRITRVGRHLRTWKLDELPQLYNVLRGEMSLVGPRPEVATYVEMFRPEYEEILTVRPGLTDPASIEFSDEQSVLAASDDPARAYREEVLPRKLQLSRGYVADRSLSTDWKLVMRTLSSILGRTSDNPQ